MLASPPQPMTDGWKFKLDSQMAQMGCGRQQAIAGCRHRRKDSGKGREATVRETRKRKVEERAATSNMHTQCNCWGMVSFRSGASL